MIIRPFAKNDAQGALEIFLGSLRRETCVCPALPRIQASSVLEDLKSASAGASWVVEEDNRLLAYMVFEPPYKTDSELQANLPLWGMGAVGCGNGKYLDKLLQKCMEALCREGVGSFRASRFRQDTDAQNLFSMTGFALDLSAGVRFTEEAVSCFADTDGIRFCEMNRSQLLGYREDVLAMYRDLIETLRHSPIFYPCLEFLPLEERFEEFLGEDTRFFAMLSGQELVGMIDAEAADAPLFRDEPNAKSVGDVFVKPKWRGKGLADALLRFAQERLRQDGVEKLCVTHGTINPLARGFWDRHFQVYCYSMQRDIDARMLGTIVAIA